MDDPSAPLSPPTTPAALPPEDRAPEPSRFRVPRGLLWALALAVVVLTILSWVALSTPEPADQTGHAGHVPTGFDLTGKPAPATTYAKLDGGTATLADLHGSPVVLNFWGAWCPPCITEMPAFERVHRTVGDKVSFLGLAVNDNETTARSQQRRTGVTYPLGLDPEYAIAKSFGVLSIPATVLIDRNGTVVHVVQGPALTEGSLSSLIHERLGV
jgi:peroxiredoxin